MGKATGMMRALGLMSGTSMDGVDVACLETDGEDFVKRGAALTFPYGDDMRRLLVSAIADAKDLKSREERPGSLAAAERELTTRCAAAVAEFLKASGVDRSAVDVIGFHGQTVLHRAPAPHVHKLFNGSEVTTSGKGLTVQLGLGQKLADLTGRPVAYDMRAADVAAGGQGAPLAPAYHRALASALPERPIALVNIGGVANATWIGRDGRLIAFDTGPGNALIDDFMMRRAGVARDNNGEVAARGSVSQETVRAYLNHPYFAAPPPKSLDRNAFNGAPIDGLNLEDGAATLAAFTAAAIARAREHMPEEPQMWVISGGGRRNRTLMTMIAGLVENAVVPAEAAGFDGDALEAEAWAYLAVRCVRGLPITFPGTTGAPKPMTGGVLAEPQPRTTH